MTDERTPGGLIIPRKVAYCLGMLEVSTPSNEVEILQAGSQGAKAPPGWSTAALAVHIAASRECQRLKTRIDALEETIEGLAKLIEASTGDLPDVAKMIGQHEPVNVSTLARAVAEPEQPSEGLHMVPDPEELEESYRERLRQAKATAEKGPGWPFVVGTVFGAVRRDLAQGKVSPKPSELLKIEQWLDQNAKRGPAL